MHQSTLRRRSTSSTSPPMRCHSSVSDSTDEDEAMLSHPSLPRAKNIGIIGGGVSGVAAAKAFQSQGHDVTIFERLPSIGGVWHPTRSYPNIETQVSRELFSVVSC